MRRGIVLGEPAGASEGLEMLTAHGGELYGLLKRIAALKRAPKTRKGQYHASRSPYKPVLLLTVLRRIEQGREPYASNRMEFEACVRDFRLLYSRVFGEPEEIQTKVTQAFWYLGSGSPKLWNLSAKPGKEEELQVLISRHAQIKTPGKLKKLVSSASFCEADWLMLRDRDVLGALISFILSEHFSDVRQELARL